MSLRTDDTLSYLGTAPFADCEAIDFYHDLETDIIFPTTECCGATATGSEGATCCRACYEEIDPVFGICWSPAEWAEEPCSRELVKND